MLLSELREGQRATVIRVGGDGNLRRRIQEMGILKGTEVYVEKYAPLKDPLELIVKGYHISLRVEEASEISVENVNSSEQTPGRTISIALAGNPNSGKTTMFNNITGARQKVGNWAGVTVEKKEGIIHKFGYELKIIDLPGTYSLTPFSIEEIIARNYILDDSPDVVIDIIDASNLERSLYLATQLRELDCKVLYVLNMADVARSRGIKIDAEKLSELLDIPVVFTVGNKNQGTEDVLKRAIELAESEVDFTKRRRVKYSNDIEDSVQQLQQIIITAAADRLPYNPRWISIKLLEDDKIIKEKILQYLGDDSEPIMKLTHTLRRRLAGRFNDEPEIIMTDERYGFIAGIIKEIQIISSIQRIDISRNIDLILTNRFLGFPIFFFFIWAMFQITFSLGEYPMAWIEKGIQFLSAYLAQSLPDMILKELLLDGVIAGVGSVIIFLPNILILFLCIAIFEDTGYMARAAFLMDKIMHLIGLHGKSFIPMLMGFGCNVPAIMATRTLESHKDRVLTVMITPFMSCSARLPIYIVLAGAFFGHNAGTVIFLIYLTGILIAVASGKLFRSTLLKGLDAPFVMELPPYRIPMVKSLLIHMWDRSKMFLQKMGGIILIGSVVIWALSAFPRNINYSEESDSRIAGIQDRYDRLIGPASDDEERDRLIRERDHQISLLVKKQNIERAEKSYLGIIGKTISPVFAPLGIDWRGSVALLTGFVAKEIVVSTMGILYVSDNKSESDELEHVLISSGMTPLAALSLMVFVLLYLPCLATLSAIRRETGSVRWALFNVGYSSLVAWVMSFCIYNVGKYLGFN